MGRVVLTLLGVFPNRLAVPIHLFEAREAAGIVLRGVHDVAVVEQVRIRSHRPRVNDAALQVEEEGAIADAEKRVARQGPIRVAEQQFGRALEALVGVKRTKANGQEAREFGCNQSRIHRFEMVSCHCAVVAGPGMIAMINPALIVTAI